VAGELPAHDARVVLLVHVGDAPRGHADAARQRGDHAELLRRREGDAQLQRDGRGQGGAGGVHTLPRRRPRPAGHPRERGLGGAVMGSARALYKDNVRSAPLRRGVELDELGGTALYLLSDLGGAVTGEIHYVDGGFNALGMPQNLDEVLAAMSRSTD